MFKNTTEIINTLEEAIQLFGSTNSALSREKAKLMVVASRHALQALALDFAKERFPLETGRIIEVSPNSSRISKNGSGKKHHLKRV